MPKTPEGHDLVDLRRRDVVEGVLLIGILSPSADTTLRSTSNPHVVVRYQLLPRKSDKVTITRPNLSHIYMKPRANLEHGSGPLELVLAPYPAVAAANGPAKIFASKAEAIKWLDDKKGVGSKWKRLVFSYSFVNLEFLALFDDEAYQ